LCLLNASFSKQHHNTTTGFFYSEIDDHGVRPGDTVQILAQWWRTVASRVAVDLPYWAMRLVVLPDPHGHILMTPFAGSSPASPSLSLPALKGSNAVFVGTDDIVQRQHIALAVITSHHCPPSMLPPTTFHWCLPTLALLIVEYPAQF